MTLDPDQLAQLLASPRPDCAESLREEAYLLGGLEAVIEWRLSNVRTEAERRRHWQAFCAGHERDLGAQGLLEGSQAALDAALTS